MSLLDKLRELTKEAKDIKEDEYKKSLELEKQKIHLQKHLLMENGLLVTNTNFYVKLIL